LKPKSSVNTPKQEQAREATKLTETNLFEESNTGGRFLYLKFFGVKEHTFLLLESLLSLYKRAELLPSHSPEYQSS
jgi:hypothetical protein